MHARRVACGMRQEVVVHGNQVVVIFRELNHATKARSIDAVVWPHGCVLVMPVYPTGANSDSRHDLIGNSSVVETVLSMVPAAGRLTVFINANLLVLWVNERVVARDAQLEILAVN